MVIIEIPPLEDLSPYTNYSLSENSDGTMTLELFGVNPDGSATQIALITGSPYDTVYNVLFNLVEGGP